MLQMRNIWQPRLPFAIFSDFCKLHTRIQILVETFLSHSGRHLEKSRRVLRTIEFYAAAGKNCSWTSNFHSGMHPATGFQNSTHLRQTRESQKHFGLSHLDIHFCPYFLNSKFSWGLRCVLVDNSTGQLVYMQLSANCMPTYRFSLKPPWVILGPT